MRSALYCKTYLVQSPQLMYISPQEAKQKQENLRARLSLEPLNQEIATVAGADISFNRGSDTVFAGIVVLSYPGMNEIARSLVVSEVDFPYIPGLLAFREIPPLMDAWEQLRMKPDVLIMDGHGIAHPRRMGIATHFGILADHPTIGCAKKVLTGSYEEPDGEKGSFSYLTDGEERIGMALRSRTNVNPVFISPGHNVSFEECRDIVMGCLSKYKLPETTRVAHDLVNMLRRGDVKPGYSEASEGRQDLGLS